MSGVAKDYKPGTITYHQEQANLHSRKKESAKRRTRAGIATASAGGIAEGFLHGHANELARSMTPSARDIGTAQHDLKLARNVKRIHGAGLATGISLGGAGLAIAAQGAGSHVHHATRQNVHTKRAQQARRDRSGVGKSAFGVEDERIAKHGSDNERRAVAGTLGATGAVTGRRAVRQARFKHHFNAATEHDDRIARQMFNDYAAHRADIAGKAEHLASARRIARGGTIPRAAATAAAGAAAGIGLAEHEARKNRKRRLNKSAFGVDDERIAKRDYSAKERRKLAAEGDARPGGRFPIKDKADLKDALRRWGDASPKDRAYIRRRAQELGASLKGTGYAGSGKHGSGDASGKKMFQEQKENTVGKSAFGVDDDRVEVEKAARKSAWRRPSSQNTRAENIGVGAASGAAGAGGVAGGLGATSGAMKARRGLRSLEGIGAAPNAVRRAAITATEVGRGAKRLAVPTAIGGAVFGAAMGADAPARKHKKHK